MQEIQTIKKIALDINNSIWVSASAGSGKTTILVNRLLSLLLNGVDISKIVCITFTKTGTHEMKERIYEVLAEWAVISDEELKLKIQAIVHVQDITNIYINNARILFAKVIDNVDNLKIFTIHSFCQQILSRFPIEAGILPNFEVIDEYESKSLIQQAINELLNNLQNYPEVSEDIKKLILEKNEEEFFNFINYLISKRKDFELLKNSNYNEVLKKVFLIDSSNKDELINSFIDRNYCNLIELNDFIQSGKFTDNQKNNLSFIKLFIISENKKEIINQYLNVFLTKEHDIRNFNNFQKKLDENLYNILIDEAKNCYNFFDKLDNIKFYNLTLSTIKVATVLINIYKKIKKNKGVLDFDDLIITTLHLLQNTDYSDWINYKLDNGIDHILLDEAQDTSTLQWKIIEALTNDFFSGDSYKDKKQTLFVVGDEKQSIFKFQGANPQMFNDRYKYYKELIQNSKSNFYKIDLQYSFRSLKNILLFVDNVFMDEQYIKKISSLEEKIIHKNIRENGLGYIEIWPLIDIEKKDKNAWKIDFENDDDTKKQEILASYIVKKIQYLTNSGRVIVDKTGKTRSIDYRDIMILFKNRNPIFLPYLIRCLNKNNIRNSGFDRINIFDNIFIKDLISFFTFILFNDDDLNLANIVKSPILNLKEDDLLELSLYKNKNNITLFESIKNIEKYKKQYLFLNDIIEKSKNFSIYELCFYILETCKIRKNVLDRFSDDTNMIINEFMDFIKSYQEKDACSLLNFIYFVNTNRNELKKDLDSSDINQVRIMTVHASKGMQAPIVFIADSNVNVKIEKEELLWLESEYGYSIPFYKPDSKSNVIKDIKFETNYDLHSEYFRLFYVAATRAENELYICGCANKTREDSEKNEIKNTWYDLAIKSLKRSNYIEKEFEYNVNQNKLVFGEEKFGCFIKNETKDEIINFDLLNNIKKYDLEVEHKKIISPSQFFSHLDRDKTYSSIDKSILKGNAIHKLLEVLPMAKINDRSKISDIYLKNLFTDLSEKEKLEIKDKVLKILLHDKYSEFFGENSKGEVDIVGEVDGFMVSGRIDRLIEMDNKIIVLDYKNTSKNYKALKELPIEYIKQLDLYRKLLEKIYLNKKIECYIFITSYLNLIKIF